MKSNNIALKTVALMLLGLLATACGHSSSVTGPTTGLSSLAVTVNGIIAGQASPISSASGSVVTVAISGPTSASPVKVDASGVARFSGLADGSYTVTATADYGFQGNQAQVAVSGNMTTTLALPSTYDLKLLAVTANGVLVHSGDKVQTPTNLQFQVQLMNTGAHPSIDVAPIVEAGFTDVGFIYVSAPVPVGSQTLTFSIPNFRPCAATPDGLSNYTSTCFTQTTKIVFSVSTGTIGGVNVLQSTNNFVMNF